LRPHRHNLDPIIFPPAPVLITYPFATPYTTHPVALPQFAAFALKSKAIQPFSRKRPHHPSWPWKCPHQSRPWFTPHQQQLDPVPVPAYKTFYSILSPFATPITTTQSLAIQPFLPALPPSPTPRHWPWFFGHTANASTKPAIHHKDNLSSTDHPHNHGPDATASPNVTAISTIQPNRPKLQRRAPSVPARNH
jgi:hypothetical protein